MRKLLICLILFFLLPVLPAYADINPPEPAGQGNLHTAQSTKVQMKNEKVVFVLSKPLSNINPKDSEDGKLPMKVTAEFTMYNTSDNDEVIDITFPTCDNYSSQDNYCVYQKFTNFIVRSNGNVIKQIKQVKQTIPTNQLAYCPEKKVESSYYKWNQTFPSKKSTSIVVSYDLDLGLYTPSHNYYIDYILSTGGNWFGKIEHGEVIFTLPTATHEDYFNLTSGTKSSLSTNLKKTAENNNIHVVFDNLKPTVQENLHLVLFDPTKAVSIESLKILAKSTNTSIAYANLGGEYAKLSTIHSYYENNGGLGGINFTEKAVVYFTKALELASSLEDLHLVTNKVFFIKNGGNETEAQQLNDTTCLTDNPFCSRFGNWVDFELTKNRPELRAIFNNLAIKRLSLNNQDQFAINLMAKLNKITPAPSQITPTKDKLTHPTCAPVKGEILPTSQLSTSTVTNNTQKKSLFEGMSAVVGSAGGLLIIAIIAFVLIRKRKGKVTVQEVSQSIAGQNNEDIPKPQPK